MPAEILFKEENEKLFWENWGKFVNPRNTSSRYLRLSIEHSLSFLENLYCDKSFIFLENGEPAACVFLPVVKNRIGLSVDFRGDYVDAPLVSNARVQKKVFSIIDDLAEKMGILKIKFTIDVLSDEKFNYLTKYGFLDSSILTYVIGLAGSADLWKDCNENHRRNIKKIKSDERFSVFFMGQKNASRQIFEEFVELHHKCSGRVTRPKITFDMQLEKIKSDSAVLVGLKYEGKNIAFVYFEYSGERAIYGSAADDPDYDKQPLYHILILSAMEYLKGRGVHFIDTGQPSCPSPQFDYYIDKKQENIALFKRGFAGSFRENFRGIKYFSKQAFDDDAQNFINNFKNYDQQ